MMGKVRFELLGLLGTQLSLTILCNYVHFTKLSQRHFVYFHYRGNSHLFVYSSNLWTK